MSRRKPSVSSLSSSRRRRRLRTKEEYEDASFESRPSTESESGLDVTENSKAPMIPPVIAASETSRWRNWWLRSFWTLVMIGGFVGIILAGYWCVVLLVMIIQTIVFKEVIAIAHVPSQEKKLPWFRSVNWYFLFSFYYFLYGESFLYYCRASFLDAFLVPFATHHRFISFVIYVIGLVFFVLNLRKGYYKFQFSQFGFTHMTLLLVVGQSHFIMNNIFEGLIWFLLPVALVIFNDIFAYVFGFFFGRTMLIKLSPKKTWEGFIGSFVMTLVAGFFLARLLAQFSYVTCPVTDLWASYKNYEHCEPDTVFVLARHSLSPAIRSLIRHLIGQDWAYLLIAPIQWHALAMAVFASSIAPFGGFFASGVKRAFKVKDFADSIPGHGGLTDRMDCQFMMGMFSYLYYLSFIKVYNASVGDTLDLIVRRMTVEQQLLLFRHLREYLEGQGHYTSRLECDVLVQSDESD